MSFVTIDNVKVYMSPSRFTTKDDLCYSTSKMFILTRPSASRLKICLLFFFFFLVATGPVTRTVSRLRLSFVLRTCVGPLVAAVAAILMKRLVQLMRYSWDE